jgi:hypothetical protein
MQTAIRNNWPDTSIDLLTKNEIKYSEDVYREKKPEWQPKPF